jgi:hypothetical protein
MDATLMVLCVIGFLFIITAVAFSPDPNKPKK